MRTLGIRILHLDAPMLFCRCTAGHRGQPASLVFQPPSWRPNELLTIFVEVTLRQVFDRALCDRSRPRLTAFGQEQTVAFAPRYVAELQLDIVEFSPKPSP
jgi:hypothetical protein